MEKMKGEVTLGNGMVMILDHSAMFDFQALTGKNPYVKGLMNVLGSGYMPDLRSFYYVCLKRHNPTVTLEECADYVVEYPDAMIDLICEAFPGVKEALKKALDAENAKEADVVMSEDTSAKKKPAPKKKNQV